jgi:hypothetical protein
LSTENGSTADNSVASAPAAPQTQAPQTPEVPASSTGDLSLEELDAFGSDPYGEQEAEQQQDGTADAAKDAQEGKDETGDDGAGKSEEEKQSPDKRTRSERRIAQLNARLGDAQRQIAQLHGRIRGGQWRAGDLDPLDFRTDADYQAALLEATFNRMDGRRAQQEARELERETLEATQELWNARAEAFRTSAPDFDAVVYSDKLPLNETTLRSLPNVDGGARIAYYLGKNPSDAARLARMSPQETLIELGRLEEKTRPPPARKISEAPQPVQTLAGGSSASPVTPDGDDYDAYEAWHSKTFR